VYGESEYVRARAEGKCGNIKRQETFYSRHFPANSHVERWVEGG
jgi:hypothetical protein